MVARQSKMAIKNHNTEHRVKTHTCKPGSPHQSESESEVAQSCLTLCDLWTVAHQAPPSTGFSRQEYWSGLPFPSPADLPDPGIKPEFLASPAMAGKFFANCSTWEYRRRQWHPTAVLLPGKSHGLRSLVGCSPWGR